MEGGVKATMYMLNTGWMFERMTMKVNELSEY